MRAVPGEFGLQTAISRNVIKWCVQRIADFRVPAKEPQGTSTGKAGVVVRFHARGMVGANRLTGFERAFRVANLGFDARAEGNQERIRRSPGSRHGGYGPLHECVGAPLQQRATMPVEQLHRTFVVLQRRRQLQCVYQAAASFKNAQRFFHRLAVVVRSGLLELQSAQELLHNRRQAAITVRHTFGKEVPRIEPISEAGPFRSIHKFGDHVAFGRRGAATRAKGHRVPARCPHFMAM